LHMPSIAVIIPCYNEAARLQQQAFLQWINTNEEVYLFFVNDGSTDATKIILEQMQVAAPERISLIDLPQNKGKGEAVRQGVLSALLRQFDFIGYLDADLSTSTNEFFRLYRIAVAQNADLVFASRIKLLGSIIERSGFRHIAGRMVATVIDNHFKLGCYDTQCGAKIFKSSLLKEETQQPFYTKWFFDVELFLRMKKKNCSALEIPLHEWRDKKASKINVLSFPQVLKELITLFRHY
jgi:dolichyl-phosphate beta-glucosyltransferase